MGVEQLPGSSSAYGKGCLKGIVVQKAFKMGYLGVTETVRMLQGKPYDENAKFRLSACNSGEYVFQRNRKADLPI